MNLCDIRLTLWIQQVTTDQPINAINPSTPRTVAEAMVPTPKTPILGMFAMAGVKQLNQFMWCLNVLY